MKDIYQLSNWNRLVIEFDNDADTPRADSNLGKICIQDHRRYTFPNELDFNFAAMHEDGDMSEMEELSNRYYIFQLDCYEHSGISLWLSWSVNQCAFDTSKSIWFIAVPKVYNGWDSEERTHSKNQGKGDVAKDLTFEEAEEIARNEMKQYTQWMNWYMFMYVEETPKTYVCEDDWDTITHWVQEEGCSGYYSIEDILDEYTMQKPEKINS